MAPFTRVDGIENGAELSDHCAWLSRLAVEWGGVCDERKTEHKKKEGRGGLSAREFVMRCALLPLSSC